MFKKLITNLPSKPSLMGQIAFYTTRLKQEEFSRRLGLILTSLALLLNINLMAFGPDSSALAAPGNDIISGGIYGSTVAEMQNQAIEAMRNDPVTKAVFEYYGITQQDIKNTSIKYLNTGDPQYRSVGQKSIGRGGEVCRTHNGIRFCERSMYAAFGNKKSNVKALVGSRDGVSSDPWFAILESCGNVVIRTSGDEEIYLDKVLGPKQTGKVMPGDRATYRLRFWAKENGARKISIEDTLPQYVSYISHTPKDLFDKVQVNGQKIKLFSSNNTAALGTNEERTVDIIVKISEDAPDRSLLCNNATITSNSDKASVTNKACLRVRIPPEKPLPEVTCDSLVRLSGDEVEYETTADIDDYTVEFEASASATNASISSFTFDYGDGESEDIANTESNSVRTSHTYSENGQYIVTVTVNSSEGQVSGQSCQLEIEIDEPVCEFNPNLPASDPNCLETDPHITQRKQAKNITQSIDDAHNTTAYAGDTIEYKLIVQNDGGEDIEDYEIVEDMADVLEYANLIDSDGGDIDQSTNVITWPKVDIAIGQQEVKTIIVKIKSPIPNTPQAQSDATSFDLRMENYFGNNVTIKLPKTPAKQVERIVKDLPNTGPGESIAVGILVVAIISYFYMRNRLIIKELDLIRREFA